MEAASVTKAGRARCTSRILGSRKQGVGQPGGPRANDVVPQTGRVHGTGPSAGPPELGISGTGGHGKGLRRQEPATEGGPLSGHWPHGRSISALSSPTGSAVRSKTPSRLGSLAS